MLFNYISLPLFLASFAIGLFFVYVLGPDIKPIYIYPTPDNYEQILFQDKAENCFSYVPEETKCPYLPQFVTDIPVQT